MIIKLVNCKHRRVRFDIGEDFTKIDISVITGDEVAEVLYKNGCSLKFDSCPEGMRRDSEQIDFSYELYNKEKGIDHLHDVEWLMRGDGEAYVIDHLFVADNEDDKSPRHPKNAHKSVFISLPMSGREDEEIQKDIADAKQQYLMETGLSESDVYFYNNLDGGKTALRFEKDLAEENGANWIAPPEDKMSLWYLGIALNNLAYCDEAIFYGNWQGARGCLVEYDTCVRYDIPMKYYEPQNKLIKKLTEDVKAQDSSLLTYYEAKYVLGILKEREKGIKTVKEKSENDTHISNGTLQTDDNDTQKKCCYHEYNKKEPCCTHECDGCSWYI